MEDPRGLSPLSESESEITVSQCSGHSTSSIHERSRSPIKTKRNHKKVKKRNRSKSPRTGRAQRSPTMPPVIAPTSTPKTINHLERNSADVLSSPVTQEEVADWERYKKALENDKTKQTEADASPNKSDKAASPASAARPRSVDPIQSGPTREPTANYSPQSQVSETRSIHIDLDPASSADLSLRCEWGGGGGGRGRTSIYSG